jgi:cytochrome P450
MRDCTIAEGTKRATAIAEGTVVYVGFSSAMRDPRRVRDPKVFNPCRPIHEMMHFGHGLHECFAAAINWTLLPLILKPLLRRGVRRVKGPDGLLRKRGAFRSAYGRIRLCMSRSVWICCKAFGGCGWL